MNKILTNQGDRSLYDGTEKHITLICEEIAPVKQFPYLIKSLKKIMPHLTISLGDHYGYFIGKYTNLIFETLSYEGIDESNILATVILKEYSKLEKLKDINPEGYYQMFRDYYDDTSKIKLRDEIVYINPFKNTLKNKQIVLGYDKSFMTYGDGDTQQFVLPIDGLKFEKRKLLDDKEIKELRSKYKIKDDEKVVVFGSCRSGEISFLEKTFKEYTAANKKHKVLFVPRNRGNDHASFQKFDIENDYEGITGKKQFISIYEKGVLDKIYALANVVLIGNSFEGSIDECDPQNPLEPAFYGKKIISGRPWCSHYNLVAGSGLLESGLVKIISDPQLILEDLMEDVDHKKRQVVQKKASQFIEKNQGYADMYAKLIQKWLYENLDNINGKIYSEMQV